MLKAAQLLYQFFSGFGIPAYEENSVPDDAVLPYITYEIAVPDWRDQASISATVWYPGTSYIDLFKKVDEIEKKVGGGLRVPADDGGCLWIYKDQPFAQAQPTNVDNAKCVYLLFGLHALCN